MRSGREDGCGHVYDQDARLLLYQDEYVVSREKVFVSSNCPDAPYPLTEGDLYLTNWRLVAIGPKGAHVDVQTVTSGTQRHLSVIGDASCACEYIEVYLDEVKEFKKTLMGELKLRMHVGQVEISGLSKPFRVELLKALEWYLTPRH